MSPIKSLEQITTEKAETIQTLSNKIDDFVVTLNPQFDEALVAMFALIVYKLKTELSEAKFEELTAMSVQDTLDQLFSDSIHLTYKKQARETN